MSTTHLLRVLLAAVLCARVILTASGASSSAASKASNEEVVELPPLEVQAPGTPAPPWRYAALPGVEVLSRCSDGDTRDLLEVNDRLEQMLEKLLPADLQARSDVPKIMIFAGQTSAANSAQNIVTDSDKKAGRAAASENAIGAGVIPRTRVRFMPNLGLQDIDNSVVYVLVSRRGISDDLTLTPEHVRLALRRRAPQLPAWFVEGFMGVFRDLRFGAEAKVFGLTQADWVSPEETAHFREDPDYPRVMLPMRQLFDSAAAPVGLWRSQAMLFVRWALFAENGKYRNGLYNLLRRVASGPVSEQVFEECLGLNFADVRDRLSEDLPDAVENRLTVPIGKLREPPKPVIRLASPLEIARLKGEWERLEIAYVRARHPQWVGRYVDQAHRTITQGYERASQDARMLTLVGLFECDIGNDEAARPYLEAAASQHVVRPRVYVELARLRLKEAMKPADARAVLTRQQIAAIFEPLLIARQQSPQVLQTFNVAAETLGRSEVRLAASEFAIVEEGVRLFPASPALLYLAARMYLVQGRPADAQRLIRQAMIHARTDPWKTRFEELAKAGG